MADNPSNQPAPAKVSRSLRLALASVFLPLAAVVSGGILFSILPVTLFIALPFGLILGMISFCLSIFSIVGSYRRRMAGTFMLGLLGFVLSSGVGIFSF